jgi:hypothetical protein
MTDLRRMREDVETFVMMLAMEQHPNAPLHPAARAQIDSLVERAGGDVLAYMRRYPNFEAHVRAAVATALDSVRASDASRQSTARAFLGNATGSRELRVL